MLMRRITQAIDPEVREFVEAFLKGLDIELSKYTFKLLVTSEASIRFVDYLPEYPKLFVRLSWSHRDGSVDHFEGNVTFRELIELGEGTNSARWDFTYHFARMLLSSIALSENVGYNNSRG